MKQKNAFTLIEVLAVVTLLALLTLTVLPLIISRVNQSKGKIDKTVQDLIFHAAENYIDMNQTENPKKQGNIYCIPLKTLVDHGHLKEPLINPSTKEKIDLNQYVKVTFLSDVEAEYTTVSICTEKGR